MDSASKSNSDLVDCGYDENGYQTHLKKTNNNTVYYLAYIAIDSKHEHPPGDPRGFHKILAQPTGICINYNSLMAGH